MNSGTEPREGPRSEENLIAALRRGDLGAFEELVRRERDGLYAYFFRMVGDRGWAEDLCQETFLRVFRNRQDLLSAGEWRAWFYRIAKNLALDHLRRERRRSRDPMGGKARSTDPSGERDTPPLVCDARELEDRIGEAILELPPRFRNVFVLCTLEGRSYEEVARIEGCPVKTVSSRLARARRRFVRILRPHLEA